MTHGEQRWPPAQARRLGSSVSFTVCIKLGWQSARLSQWHERRVVVVGFAIAVRIDDIVCMVAHLWQQAVLSPPMEAMAEQVLPWLPDDLSKRISYEKKEEVIQQSH